MALHSYLFEKYRWLSTIVVYIYVLSISSTDSIEFTIEKPKLQQTTAKLDILGIETFDGLNDDRYPTYETNFGNSSYKGVYHNLRINDRNYYGGAEGKGFYPLAYEWSYYRLTITQDGTSVVCPGTGPNYFGLWISSFDADNRLEFYYKGNRIYALSTQDAIQQMSYWHRGNPTYWWLRLPIERYVFVNFFFNDMTYDEIYFIAQGHKFESDNHSVGRDKIKFCEVTPASTTTTSTLPTSVPTLPTTTLGPISTEGVTLSTTAPTLPTTTLGPFSTEGVTLSTTAPTLPTTTPRPISTEEVAPVSTTTTPALSTTTPTLPLTTLGPISRATKAIKAAVELSLSWWEQGFSLFIIAVDDNQPHQVWMKLQEKESAQVLTQKEKVDQ